MDCITNKRKVGDVPLSGKSSSYSSWLSVITNQVMGQNLEIMDDIKPTWMKHCNEFSQTSCSWRSNWLCTRYYTHVALLQVVARHPRATTESWQHKTWQIHEDALLQPMSWQHMYTIRHSIDHLRKAMCYSLNLSCSCPMRMRHINKRSEDQHYEISYTSMVAKIMLDYTQTTLLALVV